MKDNERRCNKCTKNLTLDKFRQNPDDTYQKLCTECNLKQRQWNNNKRENEYVIEDNKRRCNACKVNLKIEHFKRKPDDTYQKLCDGCNSRMMQYKRDHKCPHKKRKGTCRDCNGSEICPHDKRKGQCKECNGGSICLHKIQRGHCKKYNPAHLCSLDKRRSRCRECNEIEICPHERIKSTCKECGGSRICDHGRERSTCKVCDPVGHLKNVISSRIRDALKSDKELRPEEYIGCDIETLRTHLEKQFTEGMTWENQGLWHIDHIIPVLYNSPTLEQKIERLHYTNLQPLWAADNLKKCNRHTG